ncbi:MAG: MoaD/ThiS family protein [Burkholderiales bacterium]|nr:MoaD/ThiS family protein [Burkholderiales bacterium]
MTLHLVYLARLREAFGCAGESLTLPMATTATVADVTAALVARGGAYANELAAGRRVRVAVNHEVVTAAHRVLSGDEVAFFPPVTGG